MMTAVIRVLVLGLSLSLLPLLSTRSTPIVALSAIALGVLASAALDERLDEWTLSAGALAALLFVAIGPASPIAASALFVVVASAPRATRAVGRAALATHTALALLGGALGAWTSSRFGADATLAVRAASLVASGLLACLVSLVAVEDRIAHALAGLAESLSGDISAALSRAATLRRRAVAGEAVTQLPGETRVRVEAGWRSLLESASRRASLGADLAPSAALIDQRIVSHIEVLERVHAAVVERAARTLGLDDRGLAAATLEREGIEAEVRALAEVAGAPRA